MINTFCKKLRNDEEIFYDYSLKVKELREQQIF